MDTPPEPDSGTPSEAEWHIGRTDDNSDNATNNFPSLSSVNVTNKLTFPTVPSVPIKFKTSPNIAHLAGFLANESASSSAASDDGGNPLAGTAEDSSDDSGKAAFTFGVGGDTSDD